MVLRMKIKTNTEHLLPMLNVHVIEIEIGSSGVRRILVFRENVV